jgi:putative membrane protein
MKYKHASKIIYSISIAVLALVVLLYNLPQAKQIPTFIKYLPTLNACINGTCFILLISSLIAIKQKKINLHKKLNITSFVLSAIFILSYVTFHSYGIETFYPKTEPLRPLYLLILITHIITAAIVLPLVLFSFYKALAGDIESHRKISKWTMPVWLYVTLTGVIVYIMISPYYNF